MSGAWGAIRTTRAPDDARTRVKRAPSFTSRSQTNTAGTASRVAFRAGCAHHSSLGAYVTAAWTIVRRPRSRKKEHEDLAEPDVVGLHEVARPRDVIPQEGRPALPVAAGPRATHVPLDGSLADADAELEQLAAEALRAPARIAGGHSRISAARAVGGRPDGRERRRQNARQPAWCQRRIVAGWTSNVASRHAGAMRAASPIVKRCHGAHRTRPAIFRCATMSCCRSRAFSATRPARRRTTSAASPTTNRRTSIMRRVVPRSACGWHL